MRLNLWLKLTLAFAAAVTGGMLVAVVLVDRSTAFEFGRYLEHTGSMGSMMGPGMRGMMGLPETDFLTSVRNSLWIAGGLVVAISAALALLLSRQITSPIRRLSTAASWVARGDMSQRVEAKSKDEVGTLTATFNSMVDSLQKNQDTRRSLMADLAHEMSTPLAVMQSNLEGMMDGVVEPSAANISSLHEEALLLSRLVRDLRTLAQAESGRLELKLAPADLGEVIGSAANAMRQEASRKGITLSMDLPPGLPWAMVDSDRVCQVLGNLLTNAFRYTSEGGKVSIRVMNVGMDEGRQGLLVSVSDTGQGIEAEDLPRVFDRYFQGAQNKEKRTGSGIGLALVKGLVEAHGGKVWAESTPGIGSTFFFTLPAV